MNGLLAVAGIAGVIFILYQAQSSAMTMPAAPQPLIPDPVMPSATAVISPLAHGIATAEGFYAAGSRAARNHNPGNMTVDLIGRAIGRDGPFVVFANDADGWANLDAQIAEWMNGSSAYAGPESTIRDLSSFYTSTQQSAWAANVATALGVSVDTPISQI